MTPRWYLPRSEGLSRPCSLEELQELAATGRLLPTDLLLAEGEQQPVPAGSLPGLFDALAIRKTPGAPRLPSSEALQLTTGLRPRMDPGDSDSFDAPPITPPAIWNPGAAAAWSLLFSPAFGAWLHASNWRRLGKPEKAIANIFWFWATLACLGISTAIAFFSDSKALDGATRVVGIGLMIGWYVTAARQQITYVRDKLPEGYVKRSWGIPILVTLGSILVYVAGVFVLVFLTYEPTPQDLAEELKPIILTEWHKQPELQGATIQKITLAPSGKNNYTGTVESTIQGHPQRFRLHVTYDGGDTIHYDLQPEITDKP